jgi:glycosyltransferase involved in cell wall biosynthesis
MMIGLPIIGLATTEMVTAIENGRTGYVETDLDKLVARMRCLMDDPEHAKELGQNAKRYASERFGIRRFGEDWQRLVSGFVEAGS